MTVHDLVADDVGAVIGRALRLYEHDRREPCGFPRLDAYGRRSRGWVRPVLLGQATARRCRRLPAIHALVNNARPSRPPRARIGGLVKVSLRSRRGRTTPIDPIVPRRRHRIRRSVIVMADVKNASTIQPCEIEPLTG